jgi:hypothetical protein
MKRHKGWMLAAGLGAGVWAGAAGAQDTFGLGVILAEPTGVSAKLWLNQTDAIDAAAAWSFSDYTSFQFHADYLIHRFDLFRDVDTRVGKPALYFGVGGRLKLAEDNPAGKKDDKLGIRVPVGVTYVFAQAPFDVFGEVVPVLDIAPDTEADFNVAVGGRFYFGRRGQLRR